MARNAKGQTLLHWAVMEKQGDDEEIIEVFKMLVEKGLDPYAEDEDEMTPLDVAAERGRENVLKLFA